MSTRFLEALRLSDPSSRTNADCHLRHFPHRLGYHLSNFYVSSWCPLHRARQYHAREGREQGRSRTRPPEVTDRQSQLVGAVGLKSPPTWFGVKEVGKFGRSRCRSSRGTEPNTLAPPPRLNREFSRVLSRSICGSRPIWDAISIKHATRTVQRGWHQHAYMPCGAPAYGPLQSRLYPLPVLLP